MILLNIGLIVLLNFIIFTNYSNAEILRFKFLDKYIVLKNDDHKPITEAKIGRSKFDDSVIEAKVLLNKSLNITGWNHLEVWGNPDFPDSEVANGAGILEGLATADFIYQHWYNTRKFFCVNKTEICAQINDFVAQNNKFIQENVEAKKNISTYWFQVHLYYQQLEGIAEGYNMIADSKGLPHLSLQEILLMNLEGDLFDLVDKFKNSPHPSKLFDEGHCTAIIKLLPNYKDLYVAHNSWFRYYAMNRILKKYILPYRLLPGSDERISGEAITFSSYPAKVNSFDDYYLISPGLAVLETTIGNSNNELWKYIQPNSGSSGGVNLVKVRRTGKLKLRNYVIPYIWFRENKVFESVRVVIANRLAKNGKSWSEIFKKYNSGTYNNQWMIVDYTKFKPRKSPSKGLLWILEQIPGYVTAADQTAILKKQTYWASYNIPFYKDVFNRSGNNELVKKYGHWYSYKNAPRAEIIRRDHKKIKDLDSLMSLMRYNDYKHDPYSRCECTPPYSASATIASRHDLNPRNGTYPLAILGHRMGGAYDAKMTSSFLIKDLKFVAVNGPSTGNNLPVFKWSTSEDGDNVPHLGLPDEWNFKPVLTEWSLK